MKAMSKRAIGIAVGAPLLFLAAVVAYAATNEGKYSGQYWIYGGSGGDRTPPSPKDANIHMAIDGPLALRLYNELGAASRVTECVAEGEAMRRRGHISCSRQTSGGQASCYFGFNLRSGKSNGGMTAC
jgi:hypothetical protein